MRTLAVATAVIFAAAAFAAERVQSGEWETTLTIASGQPMVTKNCITPAEAKLMNGDVATLRKYLVESTAAKTKGRCSVKDVVLTGNRTVVTMACGKREVTGTTTYYGNRYESTSSDGTKVTGKRLGACPRK